MNHRIIGGPVTRPDGSALPLSKVIRAGDFVFLSGQLGLDTDGKLVSGIEAQTQACLANIDALLGQAGATLGHVVKATAWLTDPKHFPAYNKAYAAAFGDTPPCRSTVCSALMLPGALVEIEVVAYAPE